MSCLGGNDDWDAEYQIARGRAQELDWMMFWTLFVGGSVAALCFWLAG